MRTTNGNNLFPVFLKLEELDVLLVGGGNAGLEKLNAILTNSPATRVTFVSDNFIPEIKFLAAKFQNVKLVTRRFHNNDLKNKDLVILALNDAFETERIRTFARKKRILVNAAD